MHKGHDSNRYNRTPAAVNPLSPEQYRVTQENSTERPFTGEYWDNHEPDGYLDAVSANRCSPRPTSS